MGGSSAERGRLGITLLPLLNENLCSRTSLPQTHRPSKDPSRRPFIPRLTPMGFFDLEEKLDKQEWGERRKLWSGHTHSPTRGWRMLLRLP